MNNAKIAQLHNEIINKTFQSANLKSLNSLEFALFSESKYLELSEILFTYYNIDASQIGVDETEFLEIIADLDETPSFNEYSKVFVNDLKEKGFVSEYFTSELLVLCEKAQVLTKSEMLNYLDGTFAKDVTENELEYRDLIVSVANSSYELWSNINLLKSSAPGSSVIIADAIGALWGLPLGGVGSIIYGALFSLYQNELVHYEKSIMADKNEGEEYVDDQTDVVDDTDIDDETAEATDLVILP
ncbi:MAG: hypothetical protein QM786_07480 [Breznakibacter sp.]